MLYKLPFFIFSCLLVIKADCQSDNSDGTTAGTTVKTAVASIDLPAPYATPSVRNNSHVVGWPDDRTPTAPAGFKVTLFAAGLDNSRWMYLAPNGDLFVSQASTKTKSNNSILLLRDANHDGIPELKKVFLSGLNRPFGMLIINDKFYVANTDGIMIFPYQTGQDQMTSPGKKILDLPAGGYNNHWTRNLLASRDGSKIYVTVGSGSNVAEHGIDNEIRRADILEINPDGTGERIYASGLRNPVGLGWAPGTNTLWTAVNERDALGDDLVPDYTTSVTENGFYGWPYSYFGKNEDPRMKGQRPDLVSKAIVPDVPLGAHTASLGLAFNEKNYFDSKYAGGLFVAQHGSWNRSELSGYKVVFVPFKDGKPVGPMEDFLTGFIADQESNSVYGRPVGVIFTGDGSLLVTDDAGDRIWSVTRNKN